MEQSPTIGQLAAALAKAQAQMGHAAKDRTNPHFKNKYATLASVIDAARGPLTANGLAVIQHVEDSADGVLVRTMLAHESGEYTSSALTVPVAKRDAQGLGSAITYGRRYGYAVVGIAADDDDDGNAAAKAAPKAEAPPPAQREDGLADKARKALGGRFVDAPEERRSFVQFHLDRLPSKEAPMTDEEARKILTAIEAGGR